MDDEITKRDAANRQLVWVPTRSGRQIGTLLFVSRDYKTCRVRVDKASGRSFHVRAPASALRRYTPVEIPAGS